MAQAPGRFNNTGLLGHLQHTSVYPSFPHMYTMVKIVEICKQKGKGKWIYHYGAAAEIKKWKQQK